MHKPEPMIQKLWCPTSRNVAQAFVAVNVGGTMSDLWGDKGSRRKYTRKPFLKIKRIKYIASTSCAFVAVNKSGTVVGAWGDGAVWGTVPHAFVHA